jgi:gluconolactonase
MPSNNSNGNTFDFQGRQLSCEHLTRRVVRYEHDGAITIIADSYQGKRLNSPNDVVPHPDGSYWFTDPPYGGQLYEGTPDAPGPGDKGPGGKRDMHVFDVGADNKLSNQKLFSDFMIDGIKCGPDGARCDIDGNVWVSSNGNPGGRGLGYSGVTVWTPEGKVIGRIRLPEVCANIAFGGPKRNRLFMCGSQSLYALYVNTQGAAPS